jgi:hypothetical protein
MHLLGECHLKMSGSLMTFEDGSRVTKEQKLFFITTNPLLMIEPRRGEGDTEIVKMCERRFNVHICG